MNKPSALIIYLAFIFSVKLASAQDQLQVAEAKDMKRDTKIFDIVSVDGKNEKVKIIPEYVNHRLKMICSGDTINIVDFWGAPPDIRLLNKIFIEINYAVRGGSNVGFGNTLILCVNRGHLFEALHVLRYGNGETGDEKSDYHIKLTLKGNSKNNYRLNVHVHDDVDSKRAPETNYTYNNETNLTFDSKQNVFYSIKESVYDCFITTAKNTKQKIGGTFPMIILGKQTYYFINKRWCTADLDKEMFEFK
jgi:hypothetical protein